MRKYGACLAVAATAATAIAPTALAAGHGTHHASKHDVVVIKHFPRSMHMNAHIATCPPGSAGGSYCTGAPEPDSLFEVYAIPGTASIKVTTSPSDTMLVAFAGADGPKAGGQSITVSGGGLIWHRVAAQNKGLGDAEVWYAMTPNPIKNQVITATASIGGYEVNDDIVSFQNASGIGASGTFFSAKGAATGTITTTQANSWVWSSANDWGVSAKRVAGAGQNVLEQTLDNSAGKAYWTQQTSKPTPNAGTPVTLNDTSPTGDPFNLVMAEVL